MLAYFAAVLHSHRISQKFSQTLTELGLLRTFCHSPLLTDQTEPSPLKFSLFTVSFFPITSRLESAGHKYTPSLSAFTAGNTHEVQSSTKMCGAWNAIPLVFQPALRALQQPHKHSYTL